MMRRRKTSLMKIKENRSIFTIYARPSATIYHSTLSVLAAEKCICMCTIFIDVCIFVIKWPDIGKQKQKQQAPHFSLLIR